MIERFFLLLSQTTAYRHPGRILERVDHRSKTLYLLLTWIAFLSTGKSEAVIPASIPVIVYVLLIPRRTSKYVATLPLPPSIIIAFIVFLLHSKPTSYSASLGSAGLIGLRIYAVSVATLGYASTTNPVEVASLFRSIPKLHDLLVLISRFIPLSLKELWETIGVQKSLGRPVYKVLFPLTLSIFSRGDSLTESLYIRGYGLTGSRGTIRTPVGATLETLLFTLFTLVVYVPVIMYGIL
ncbi:MAG: energy-coupling factor transporter transmembrane protein EcfT [Desulfurococcales archaeon]|nr:energy-coupling factor transporter transmembrane protein EcfT [Desulfurococcales archaeon]